MPVAAELDGWDYSRASARHDENCAEVRPTLEEGVWGVKSFAQIAASERDGSKTTLSNWRPAVRIDQRRLGRALGV